MRFLWPVSPLAERMSERAMEQGKDRVYAQRSEPWRWLDRRAIRSRITEPTSTAGIARRKRYHAAHNVTSCMMDLLLSYQGLYAIGVPSSIPVKVCAF